MIEVKLVITVPEPPNDSRWIVHIETGAAVPPAFIAPITDADLATIVDLDPKVATWAGVLTHLTPRAGWRFDGTTLRRVGGLLWDRILADSPAVLAAIRAVESRAARERRGVRYVIIPITQGGPGARLLELLPLELAATREGSVCREFFFKRDAFPAVRCPPQATPYGLDLRGPVRMLVATAHADGEPHPTADELTAHAEAIAGAARKLSGWTVDIVPDATPTALRSAVTSGCYDLVHIACHGMEARDDGGVLALRGGFVSGIDLANQLSEACWKRKEPVKLVVLCACSSASPRRDQETDGMAQCITFGDGAQRDRALAAIGFRGPVEIPWAFRFMERLYAELGEGRDLDEAFSITRSVQPDHDPQWALPLLYRRPSDPGAAMAAASRRAAGGQESMQRPALVGLVPPRAARPYFVARTWELETLSRWVQQPGAAVISAVEGEGGIGKTELALKVADLAHQAGRPVLWLERADRDLRGAVLALARAAEPDYRPSPEAPLDELRIHMQQALAPHDGLLVLDDLSDASVLDTLAPGRGWNVLVTARQERFVPGAVPLKLGPLDEAAGLRLLAVVAWRAQEVPAEEREAAAKLVEALGGLPLAIEVAGAAMWQRGLSASAWLEEFRADVGPVADERARVEAVLLRSIGELGSESREALDVLAAMSPAGLDADQLAAAKGRSPVATRRHLDALVRLHLASWSVAEGRYTLHPLVREAIQRRAQADGARWDAARAAVGQVALALMRWVSEAISRNGSDARARWARAREQIEGLQLTAWNAGDPGAADVAEALGNLDQFRQFDVSPETRLAALNGAAALTVGARAGAEAGVLRARGELRRFRDDLDGAEEDYDRALTLFGEVQDHIGEANVLLARGELRRFRADLNGAEEDFDRALTLFSELRERLGQANVLKARGVLRRFRDDLDGAEEDYDRALTLFGEVQSHLGQASVLKVRGELRQFRSDLDGAEEDFDRALTLFSEVQARLGQANVLKARGELRQFRSDLDGAEKDFDRALTLFGEVQSRLGQAEVLLARGELQRFRDDLDGAEKDYDHALALFDEVQDRTGQARVLQSRGELRQFRDDLDGAEKDYDRALALFDEVQDRLGQANVLQLRGDLRRFRNDLDGAEKDYDRALTLCGEVQDRLGQARVLEARGNLAQDKQRWEIARQWYTEALPIYEQMQDHLGASNVHAELAKVHAFSGYFEEARAAATAAAALGAQSHNRYALDVAQQVLAFLDAKPR